MSSPAGACATCASTSVVGSSSTARRCGTTARSCCSAEGCFRTLATARKGWAILCRPGTPIGARHRRAPPRMQSPSRKPLSSYLLLDRPGGGTSLASAAAAHFPNALAAGALLLAYVGLEWVSFIHEYKGMPVTPWNPGLGVAFAFLVLKGAGYALVLLVGVAIAEIFVLRTDLAWPVIVGMATIVSASFATAAVIARRRLRLDIGLGHVRDVLLLLVAGAAAAAASAVLLSVLLLVA